MFVSLLLTAALADPLRTVAESSDYTATSKYADVVAFCDELAKRSPAVTVSTFGVSQEGRNLPLLTIADPPVKSAAEAAKTGKLVVLVFANIHAGEVDGKEAVLALARDLTADKGHPLLKDLVVLMVPILNADGNEKFGPGRVTRPGQNGPPEAGVRENAQGFDLNRDFIKLESPEVRALVRLLTTWDPAMVIDCHTTNGSRHRHTLTYDGPRYPASANPAPKWAEVELFPEVTAKVKKATGFDLAPYGNFSADRTRWETYPSSPRYGIQYIALRGRVGVLSESYSYASFKDRVTASYAFVKACLEVAAAKKAQLRNVVAPDAQPAARVIIRTKTEAFPDKRVILGFEEEMKDGRRATTDRPKDYPLTYVGKVVPAEFVERPAGGYLIPAANALAADTLRRHGVRVEVLTEPAELPVEAYTLTWVEVAERAFQKHKLVTAEVKSKAETRTVPAGTYFVPPDQPLGRLAVYLLEPRSEDGLTTWGLFPDLKAGGDFPVVRLPKAAALKLGPPAKLAD